MSPPASITIPTRDRCETLRVCLRAAQRQTVPVQIIVLDDGSTDRTAEMVRAEFPQVRYERFEGPNGPCFIRNRGAELATAPILFPIDDDSVMVSPRTVEQTLAEFENPRVGAVAIPFINVQQSGVIQQQAPNDSEIYVCSAFVGASHALRRDLFLELGGYREQLFYMGEEGDYCVRMLNAGYITRIGRADPIHHHESPSRAFWRMDFYARRNDVLYAWNNVPLRYLPLHLAATTFHGLQYAIRVKRPLRMAAGLLAGYAGIIGNAGRRRPVGVSAYRLSRSVHTRKMVKLRDIAPLLPSIAALVRPT